MEAQQVESGLAAVELSSQSFFSKGIYDPRFLSSDYHLNRAITVTQNFVNSENNVC